MRQGLVDERRKGRLGIGARDREPEGRKVAEMIAEPGLDQRQHLLRDCIWRGRPGPGHEEIGARCLPVLRIEIPLAAGRLIAVHQEAGLAAHVAVEIFHAQLLAARGPILERRGRAQEAIVGEGVDRDRELPLPVLQHLPHAPFAGCRDDDALRAVCGNRVRHLPGKTALVLGRIQRHIVDSPARCTQLRGEMTHGRKDEGDLLLVMADIGGFIVKLRHQHAVPRRIARDQAGEGRRQLIAEDKYQVANAGHQTSNVRCVSRAGLGFPRRIRSVIAGLPPSAARESVP